MENTASYNRRFSGIIGQEYRLFKKSVPFYDEFQNTVKKSLQKFIKKMPEISKITIIEAGCGNGATTLRILDSDIRIRVLTVDNERKIISQARKVLRNFQKRVGFIESDILSVLKIIDNETIDAFVSAYTLHNFDKKYRRDVFRELKRVLKPGGLFVNADKYPRDDKEKHQIDFEKMIRDFDIYDTLGMAGLKKEWVKHCYDDEENKFTEKEQVIMLKNMGFVNIKTVFRKRVEATIIANKKKCL
jgi:tRNA (cmo5U34)-methyltransferase